jgi:hypothetical protein
LLRFTCGGVRPSGALMPLAAAAQACLGLSDASSASAATSLLQPPRRADRSIRGALCVGGRVGAAPRATTLPPAEHHPKHTHIQFLRRRANFFASNYTDEK